MTDTVALGPIFSFPAEATLISRIVLGYSELEVGLWELAQPVLRDDQLATKLLFSPRNHEARLSVADAVLRPAYTRAGMLDEYENIFGEIGRCKKARNKYAHSFWDEDEGVLLHISQAEIANPEGGKAKPIDINSLEKDVAAMERVRARIPELIDRYTRWLVKSGRLNG